MAFPRGGNIWYTINMPHIKEVKGTKVSWVHATRTSKEELLALKKRFRFDPLDLADCAPPLQRVKLVERSSYLFLILLFPVFDRKSRQVKPVEVDFFIGKNYLVTINQPEIEGVKKIFESAQKDRHLRMKLLGESPARLLYELLEEMTAECFPMLFHIERDIDSVEEKMTEIHHRATIHEIFRIKTNIINFKRSMQPHKAAARRLVALAPRFFKTERLISYFKHLVEHTKEIWDELESSSDTLDAIEDTHLSLLNFRANDIIKTLTIFAVIVFPLTLVAAIFGMNTINTPIVGHELDFWVIIAIMAASTAAMLAFFKYRRWI